MKLEFLQVVFTIIFILDLLNSMNQSCLFQEETNSVMRIKISKLLKAFKEKSVVQISHA